MKKNMFQAIEYFSKIIDTSFIVERKGYRLFKDIKHNIVFFDYSTKQKIVAVNHEIWDRFNWKYDLKDSEIEQLIIDIIYRKLKLKISGAFPEDYHNTERWDRSREVKEKRVKIR